MKRLLFSIVSFAIAAAIASGVAQAQAKPQRNVVYNFTVGIVDDNHDADMNSQSTNIGGQGAGGVASGSGDSAYTGSTSDKGQIDVVIMGVEPDGGLVTKVSEKALNTRNAAPVFCVVYPNTNAVCAQGQVNPEEYVVLRSLNPKFYDPSAVDAKGQWHADDPSGNAHFAFSAAKAGALVNITAERQEHGGPPQYQSTANATYLYDPTVSLPRSIKEFQTIRQQQGAGSYANITVDTTADLASDTKN